jgi:hypothetical protein
MWLVLQSIQDKNSFIKSWKISIEAFIGYLVEGPKEISF